jgi:hypothetical protein
MSTAIRRTWRGLVQAYHLLCARDDGAARGFSVPSGVWACERCHEPHLELSTLDHHLRTDHA